MNENENENEKNNAIKLLKFIKIFVIMQNLVPGSVDVFC